MNIQSITKLPERNGETSFAGAITGGAEGVIALDFKGILATNPADLDAANGMSIMDISNLSGAGNELPVAAPAGPAPGKALPPSPEVTIAARHPSKTGAALDQRIIEQDEAERATSGAEGTKRAATRFLANPILEAPTGSPHAASPDPVVQSSGRLSHKIRAPGSLVHPANNPSEAVPTGSDSKAVAAIQSAEPALARQVPTNAPPMQAQPLQIPPVMPMAFASQAPMQYGSRAARNIPSVTTSLSPPRATTEAVSLPGTMSPGPGNANRFASEPDRSPRQISPGAAVIPGSKVQGPTGILTSSPDVGAVQTSPPLTPSTAPLSPPTSEPASAQRPLETLIESLVTARESGRIARGDMILRHAEFGAVTVQVDHSDTDLKATLSSRDPGFAPAAKAALADRIPAAPPLPDTSQTQARGQDSGSGAMTQRDADLESQQDRNHQHGTDPGNRGPEVAPQPHPGPDGSAAETSTPSSPSDHGLLA